MITEKTNGQPHKPSPLVTEQPRFTEDDAPHKSHWLVWTIVLLVAGGLTATVVVRLIQNSKASGTAAVRGGGAIPVETASVSRGQMNIFLRELGTVTPLNTVTVRSRVDGQLTEVHYVEGQMVKEGDFLAQIDPRPFQAQVAVAEGQLAKDQSLLHNAQLDLKRYQDLAKQNFSITQQQLDTQASLVQQFEAAVQTDQGQVDSAKLQLTYCHITSPLGGRIGLRMVDQGNMVHATDSSGLAVITQVQPISVAFTVPEDDIASVLKKTMGGVVMPVYAYDREDKVRLASGTLSAIDNQADPTTAMVHIKATFSNENLALFPNGFVRAWLLEDTLRNVLLVPDMAIQHGPDNSIFVYVVKDDQTVDLHNVTIGPSEAGSTVIESGLSGGETVVTAGVDKLQVGTKVVLSKTGRGGRGAGRGGRGATSQPAAEPVIAPEAATSGGGRGEAGGASTRGSNGGGRGARGAQ